MKKNDPDKSVAAEHLEATIRRLEEHLRGWRQVREYGNRVREAYLAECGKLGREVMRLAGRYRSYRGQAYRALGRLSFIEGRVEKGREYLEKSIEVLEEQQRRYDLGKSFLELARWLLPGKNDEAAAFLDRAEEILAEEGTEEDLAEIRRLRGEEEVPASGSGDEELVDYRKKLHATYRIAAAVNSVLTPGDLLERIMNVVVEITAAERGFLMILPEKPGQSENGTPEELTVAVTRKVEPGVIESEEFALSKSIIATVRETKSPVLISDASGDRRYSSHESVVRYSLRSILCVPLTLKEKMIGIVYLDNRSITGLFDENDLEYLSSFADYAAVCIENARLYDRLKVAEEKLRTENRYLKSEVEKLEGFDTVIGESRAIRDVLDLAARVSNTRSTILIQGETGTGKEVLARAIHNASNRRDRIFIPQNCGAISDTLLESELFGHRKGAFTGADRNKPGVFEIADGGTIFLDEIGEPLPRIQLRLLRVLQDGEIKPVGGTREKHVDVRVIAATNKNLEEEVRKGNFREDLFYRLNVFPITMPPLRERKEDIPHLAAHFLRKYNRALNAAVPGIDPGAMSFLCHYSWPGNVRELENEIQRAVVLAATGQPIRPADLSPRLARNADERGKTGTGGEAFSLKGALDDHQHTLITALLQKHNGNRTRAAKELGICPSSLRRRMERLDITFPVPAPARKED